MSLLTDLKLFLPFDGNPNDTSGNGNNLTNNNSTPYSNGAVFTSANKNYFSITNAVQTGLGVTGDFAASFEFTPSAQPPGGGAHEEQYDFFQKNDEQGNQRGYGFLYSINGGTPFLRLAILNVPGAEGVWDLLDKAYTLTNGVKYLITISWDASLHTATFWIDGVSIGTATGAQGYTSIASNTASFLVGGYIDGNHPAGVEFLDGTMKNFGFWSRILIQADVDELWNAGDVWTGPCNSERSAKLTGVNEIYGIKVSKTGKGVDSTDPNDFIMNSAWGTIKFLKIGGGSVEVGASSNADITVSFTWVGGRPLVLLFVELTSSSGRWYLAPFSTAKIGVEDTYISENIDESHVTADDFVFKLKNTVASAKTINYYYFVIGETGKEDE